MPNPIKITVQGYVTETAVWVNGVKATMAYDGEKTYTTKIDTGTAAAIHFIFIAQGFDGSDWSLQIEVDGKVVVDQNGALVNNFVRREDTLAIGTGK